ncbi:hypothetical protein TrVE_jg12405 [Triparma verrucosa]|uniref:Uncharacterized protein n=1 Tax=Triparma verrucosa TaxID=1606542 RepID=A0A9W7CEL1_9STRA|nr:hypothetical protein TrVE_jg12405 [Triparma verrucosa]
MKYLRLLLLLAFPLANGFLPLSPAVSSPLRPLSVISQNRAMNSLNQKSPSTTRVPLHLHSTPEPSTPEPSNDIEVSNDYSNFPSFLKPLASSIDKSTGGWALSYADCSPETESTPLGLLFLSTNLGFIVSGLFLISQGLQTLGLLTDLAGIQVLLWC